MAIKILVLVKILSLCNKIFNNKHQKQSCITCNNLIKYKYFDEDYCTSWKCIRSAPTKSTNCNRYSQLSFS